MIYGIGTDIVEIKRIEKLINGKSRDKFLMKIFNNEELDYINSLKNPIKSVSARYAGKEAYAKALGTGIGEFAIFSEISIKKTDRGKPYIELIGKSAQSILTLLKLNSKEDYNIHISLAHESSYAIAYSMIEILNNSKI